MLTRKVLLLTGSIAVIGGNSLVLSPIAGAIAASLHGIDAVDVMNAAAVYGVATAASALTLASVLDRIGQRSALLRSMLALMVALAVTASAPNLLVLCLAQAIAGLAAGCALPAIYALSAEVAEKGRESETLGIVLTGWTVSLVAGVSLAALVADIAHWRLVFAAMAAGAAALAFELGRGGEWACRASSAHSSSPLTALRVPGIGPALLTVASFMTAFYGLYAYLGAHLTGVLRLSTASAGLAPLSYGLGFGVAAFADRLLDRYGATTAAPFAFLGLALVYAMLCAASAHAAILIGLCLAWGLGNHISLNLIVGRLTALDPAQRGAIMGLYSTVTYLTVSTGALLYGLLYSRFGLAGCAIASAGCIALAMFLFQGHPKTFSLIRRNGG